jgi:hypothetical protein
MLARINIVLSNRIVNERFPYVEFGLDHPQFRPVLEVTGNDLLQDSASVQRQEGARELAFDGKKQEKPEREISSSPGSRMRVPRNEGPEGLDRE